VAWLERLPGVVDDLRARWGLTLEAPYEPGGNCSWVAPATDAAGRDLVLKVAWVHEESMHEAEGLAAMAGDGAVGIHAYEHVDDETVAMLLVRCRPGVELRGRPEAEQDLVVARLLGRIWATALPSGHPFRPLSDLAEQWTTRAEVRLADDRRRVDPGLAREGFAQFRELAGTGPGPVLLWTDLHAGNVLSDGDQAWTMIDPKPYVGDPHYDVLQHLINCPERLLADPRGLIERIAGLTDLDPKRIVDWLKARCVVEVAAATSPWQDFAGFWSVLSGGRTLSGT
jgi:streptomycin 6-kinase